MSVRTFFKEPPSLLYVIVRFSGYPISIQRVRIFLMAFNTIKVVKRKDTLLSEGQALTVVDLEE